MQVAGKSILFRLLILVANLAVLQASGQNREPDTRSSSAAQSGTIDPDSTQSGAMPFKVTLAESTPAESTQSESAQAEARPAEIVAAANRFPAVEIAHVFAPPGESNVRSSYKLADGSALIGTEETGDVFKTTDSGQTWTKTTDGGDEWTIQDVRNFLRANDGRLYATTSEPALVLRSRDEGESWEIVARPKASRTVALTQLDTGDILVGLRRSENDKISVVRSTDHFETFDTIILDDELPRQNTTCLFDLGDGVVLCGVGYEESGKIFRSTDAGATWVQTAEFPDARDVMNFFMIGDNVFVLTSGIATMFASGDGGESWTRHAQIWTKGFLGQYATLEHSGQTYHLLAATDQREDVKRHVVLISDDGQSWHEWIELATDTSGGASNITVIDEGTIVVGTGNHSVQGNVYTLKVN